WAWAEIVHRQRGQNQADPRGLDRLAAEMTEVGIERLGTGHGEKHCAEGDKANDAMRGQEFDGVDRIKGQQDFQIAEDKYESRNGDRNEPQRGDRSEESCNFRGATRLNGK